MGRPVAAVCPSAQSRYPDMMFLTSGWGDGLSSPVKVPSSQGIDCIRELLEHGPGDADEIPHASRDLGGKALVRLDPPQDRELHADGPSDMDSHHGWSPVHHDVSRKSGQDRPDAGFQDVASEELADERREHLV